MDPRGRETKNFDVARVRKYKQIRCFETMHTLSFFTIDRPFESWMLIQRISEKNFQDKGEIKAEYLVRSLNER